VRVPRLKANCRGNFRVDGCRDGITVMSHPEFFKEGFVPVMPLLCGRLAASGTPVFQRVVVARLARRASRATQTLLPLTSAVGTRRLSTRRRSCLPNFSNVRDDSYDGPKVSLHLYSFDIFFGFRQYLIDNAILYSFLSAKEEVTLGVTLDAL
jgi:hypothetical protein